MTTHRNTLMGLLILVMAATAVEHAAAERIFRGLPLDQGGNRFQSPVFGRQNGLPYFFDLTDDFVRDGVLGDSNVDGFEIGFVPPFDGVPPGELMGAAAEAHGRWMPPAFRNDYVTSSENGGYVTRATADGAAVACLPWEVVVGLGDRYLIEMSAVIAEGETVRLGYFADVDDPSVNTEEGLAGNLGELVLGVSRGTGASADELSWVVQWNDGDERRTTRSFQPIESAVGEEVRLQLAWDDLINSGNDLFDAWLETGAGNQNLVASDMSTEIGVFGVGFEIAGGIGSQITGFGAAVPEPASGLLALGSLGLLLVVRLHGLE